MDGWRLCACHVSNRAAQALHRPLLGRSQLRGGRQLGAPNKHLEVAERLAGLRCDPITGMGVGHNPPQAHGQTASIAPQASLRESTSSIRPGSAECSSALRFGATSQDIQAFLKPH
jgi:hypothetical protein